MIDKELKKLKIELRYQNHWTKWARGMDYTIKTIIINF